MLLIVVLGPESACVYQTHQYQSTKKNEALTVVAWLGFGAPFITFSSSEIAPMKSMHSAQLVLKIWFDGVWMLPAGMLPVLINWENILFMFYRVCIWNCTICGSCRVLNITQCSVLRLAVHTIPYACYHWAQGGWSTLVKFSYYLAA